MARTKGGTVVSWPAVSAAVALLTSLRGGSDDLRADVIGDLPPAEVLAAMEIIAAALTGLMFPGDQGGRFLELLGLSALEHGTQQA